MKVLSVKQPWASLITEGYKTMELRTWKTNYRGPLAIHSSAKACSWEIYDALIKLGMKQQIISNCFHGPKGQIIAIAKLDSIITLDGLWYDNHLDSHLCDKRFFEPVKYGWVLTDIKTFDTPIPAKGKLGLWEFEL